MHKASDLYYTECASSAMPVLLKRRNIKYPRTLIYWYNAYILYADNVIYIALKFISFILQVKIHRNCSWPISLWMQTFHDQLILIQRARTTNVQIGPIAGQNYEIWKCTYKLFCYHYISKKVQIDCFTKHSLLKTTFYILKLSIF